MAATVSSYCRVCAVDRTSLGVSSKQAIRRTRPHTMLVVRTGSSKQAICALDRTSPHTVLGVRPGSSKQDIRKAYRRLALKYHPDVCKDDGVKFRNINRAYESLTSGQTCEETNEHGYATDDDWVEELWNEGWEGPWYYYGGTRACRQQ